MFCCAVVWFSLNFMNHLPRRFLSLRKKEPLPELPTQTPVSSYSWPCRVQVANTVVSPSCFRSFLPSCPFAWCPLCQSFSLICCLSIVQCVPPHPCIPFLITLIIYLSCYIDCFHAVCLLPHPHILLIMTRIIWITSFGVQTLTNATHLFFGNLRLHTICADRIKCLCECHQVIICIMFSVSAISTVQGAQDSTGRVMRKRGG